MYSWLFRTISYGLFLLGGGGDGGEAQAQNAGNVIAAEKGISTQSGHDAGWYLTQHRLLESAITSLKSQRRGVIDAYVVVVALDGDPVFQREAKETAKVLSRRYGAAGRTILLATGTTDNPAGSPANITTILAAVAAKMDRDEDVLVLYTTSHGSDKVGIIYKDGTNGFGMMGPRRLGDVINGLGIKRRLVMISACYSGIFIPPLSGDESIIITAASPVRTSFGCSPGNDWTFFGDALVNHALRTPQSLQAATQNSNKLISEWEKKMKLTPSEPQFSIGAKANIWLKQLEARMPKKRTALVGTPAIESETLPAKH